MLYGATQHNPVSTFIREIPEEHVHAEGIGSASASARPPHAATATDERLARAAAHRERRARVRRGRAARSRRCSPRLRRYTAGDVVEHKTFGRGVIARGQGRQARHRLRRRHGYEDTAGGVRAPAQAGRLTDCRLEGRSSWALYSSSVTQSGQRLDLLRDRVRPPEEPDRPVATSTCRAPGPAAAGVRRGCSTASASRTPLELSPRAHAGRRRHDDRRGDRRPGRHAARRRLDAVRAWRARPARRRGRRGARTRRRSRRWRAATSRTSTPSGFAGRPVKVGRLVDDARRATLLAGSPDGELDGSVLHRSHGAGDDGRPHPARRHGHRRRPAPQPAARDRVGSACLIVTGGAAPAADVLEAADARGCAVIATEHGTYAAARLMDLAHAVSEIMETDVLTVEPDTLLTEAAEDLFASPQREAPVDGRRRTSRRSADPHERGARREAPCHPRRPQRGGPVRRRCRGSRRRRDPGPPSDRGHRDRHADHVHGRSPWEPPPRSWRHATATWTPIRRCRWPACCCRPC